MLIINIIFIFLITTNFIIAEEFECPNNKDNVSVNIISDSYYKYEDYLHYTLGKYTYENGTKYNLSSSSEIDLLGINSDVIFGDYSQLKTLIDIKKSLPIPKYIQDFYKKNYIDNLESKNNLHPLDLDTFVLTSNQEIKNIKYEEDLIEFIDETKYTISQSFYSNIENIKFLSYLSLDRKIDIETPLFENIIYNQKEKFILLNKNNMFVNYENIVDSIRNNENLFNVVTDGYALKENLDFIEYPLSELVWDDKNGIFVSNKNNFSYPSFYGFSALINNEKGYEFLCYISRPENRDELIFSFDLGISPLSAHDLIKVENISDNYKKVLESKNKFVKNLSLKNNYINTEEFHKKFINFIMGNNQQLLLDIEINYFN